MAAFAARESADFRGEGRLPMTSSTPKSLGAATPALLYSVSWPAQRLAEAVEKLALRSGLNPYKQAVAGRPAPAEEAEWRLWIESVAGQLGLSAEPVEATYGEVEHLVASCGPGLVRLSCDREHRFLAVLSGGRRRVRLLSPEGGVRSFPAALVRASLCASYEAPLEETTKGMLDRAGVAEHRRRRTRAAVLRQLLVTVPIRGVVLLSLSPARSFQHQLSRAGLIQKLGVFSAAHVFQLGLYVVSWWIIGRAALSGRFDAGWLWAWLMLLGTLIPLQLLASWSRGRFAIGTGALLKQRLLQGITKLDPDEIRHLGAGQLFSRVVEAEAVESLMVTGGFLAAVAAIELILSAIVLSAGVEGRALVTLLLVWVILTALLARNYYRARREWTRARLDMTNDVVERILGHRTRQAQEDPQWRHVEEDSVVESYLEISKELDSMTTVRLTLVQRGWLIVAMLGLAPAFVASIAPPASLAISLGGVLLAFSALRNLSTGLTHLTRASISWETAGPLFSAAARLRPSGVPGLSPQRQEASAGATVSGQSVLVAHALSYRYPDRDEPVLHECAIELRAGDRVLLEGASGAGKSTLVSLLTGLRRPETGMVLYRGLDRETLGDHAWRHAIVASPQFHENHVLTGTFAFNLALGRDWPPTVSELDEAKVICHELGLGGLLDRMPSGMFQMVGESGWQLSHGERSRLFIARSLVQGAEIVLLDESFAALDPDSLELVVNCVLRRAKALMVIAHP